MEREHFISELLEQYFHKKTEITACRAVSGGDINSAYVLSLSDGGRVFMKTNHRKNKDFFRAEKEGLEAMKETGAAAVPSVIAGGEIGDEAFLLMEYIEEGRKTKGSSEELGRNLAKMHQADASRFVNGGNFGFLNDNYIGAGFQDNHAEENWSSFFIKRRLVPQFKRAEAFWSREDRKKIDRFLGKVEEYLTEPDRPSLLHGDLWAGNYMIDRQGRPWLIDPAVYVGHAEADLAMTELFGGFDSAFYGAYRESAGLDPGYCDRRDLYNLYHLLNHLNMFGGGYFSAVKAVITRYL